MEVSDNYDLVRIGRECQMWESLTDSEKVAIALKYQLVSKLTSLILVYERAEDDKVKGLPKIQQVPQMCAYGHGNYKAAFSSRLCIGEIDSLLGNCTMDFCEVYDDQLVQDVSDFLLQQLKEIWKAQLYGGSIISLGDFISHIEQLGSYEKLIEKIKTIAQKKSVSYEAVWATFIEALLEKYGMLDRQSLRLLKSHLPDEAKKVDILDELDLPINV